MKNCSVNKRATIFLQYGTVWYGKIALTLLMFGELRLIDVLLYFHWKHQKKCFLTISGGIEVNQYSL